MKTAIIIYKDYATGNIINEGEAILLNRMDSRKDQSFWELKFLNNPNTTHCRWVENNSIIDNPEEMEQSE